MKENKKYNTPIITVIETTDDVILTSGVNEELLEGNADYNWAWTN